MRRHPALAAFLASSLAALAAGSARTQDADSFPKSLGRDDILAWLDSATEISPATVVSVGRAYLISLSSITPQPGVEDRYRIALHAEVISPDLVAETGYRSWSGQIDIDCAAQRAWERGMRRFVRRGLAGPFQDLSGAPDWETPAPGTQLSSVVAAVCSDAYRNAFIQNAEQTAERNAEQAPSEVIATAPAAPAASPTQEPRPAPAPPSPAKPPTEPPAGPSAVASQAAASQPVPAPPPMASRPLPPEPTSPQVRRKPERTVPVAVQIGASNSEPEARDALERLRRRYPGQTNALDLRISRAVVDGRIVHRAQFTGFASRSEAAQFCDFLKTQGQDCFLRGP